MTTIEQLEKENAHLRKGLKTILDFPKKGSGRVTEDGYPLELVYDEFAYKRIIDSYRDAASHFLAVKPIGNRRA